MPSWAHADDGKKVGAAGGRCISGQSSAAGARCRRSVQSRTGSAADGNGGIGPAALERRLYAWSPSAHLVAKDARRSRKSPVAALAHHRNSSCNCSPPAAMQRSRSPAEPRLHPSIPEPHRTRSDEGGPSSQHPTRPPRRKDRNRRCTVERKKYTGRRG
jgi:hypothetical protein